MKQPLVAPFPWFGGKRRVAAEVWKRFGNPSNYVEPFFGSGAVLLSRSDPCRVETVNDADGLLCNFWRATKAAPNEVTEYANWPVSELDLTARHAWLVGQRESITSKLESDPDFFDVKVAGWWLWGICAWIGSGWCSGEGPWVVQDGRLQNLSPGRGINLQLLKLYERLRRVRIACGDWSRVVGDSVTWRHGMTAVFLDPPYPDGEIDYAVGSRVIADDVRAWAADAGKRKDMRVALCGYEEHDELASLGWSQFRWKAHGGYSAQDGENENAARECIWFSPACVPAEGDLPLFARALPLRERS